MPKAKRARRIATVSAYAHRVLRRKGFTYRLTPHGGTVVTGRTVKARRRFMGIPYTSTRAVSLRRTSRR